MLTSDECNCGKACSGVTSGDCYKCCANIRPNIKRNGNQGDYQFNTMAQSKVALYQSGGLVSETKGVISGGGTTTGGGNTGNLPPNPFPSKAFYHNINSRFQKWGCRFLSGRYQILATKLQGLQNAGTNPRWQILLQRKLQYIWNLGLKHGCWSSTNSNISSTLTGALACRKSGLSYGVKKVNGRIRGDVKRLLKRY